MSTVNLNDKLARLVWKSVKKDCCNCYENNCLLLDDGDSHTCPQLITFSHIICNYYLRAVLPADKSLVKLIKNKFTDTIKCAKCGKEIERTGRNQKYCPDCAKQNQRKRNAKYMAEKRAESGDFKSRSP